MAHKSITCDTCGMKFDAETEEELAKKFREHANNVHHMGMTEEDARQKVKMANPEPKQ